jgi:hypothetical protein
MRVNDNWRGIEVEVREVAGQEHASTDHVRTWFVVDGVEEERLTG